MKKRIIEIAVKVIVAALTAFLTAITTTSCMGYGPLYGPLPKIVKISQMKSPLAVAGGFSLKLHSRVGSCVPAVASQQSWSAYCVIFDLATWFYFDLAPLKLFGWRRSSSALAIISWSWALGFGS